MVNLKKKIKTVDSLPEEKKKKISIISILSQILIILILGTLGYFSYTKLFPYFNATDINKIMGKKTHITECNTKDYIIIGKDKSYTLSLTNENCEIKYFEGNIIIKNNEIIFENDIKGVIDNNYNVIINNKIFESDKNE